MKNNSNTNKYETKQKSTNPKICFYVNPQVFEILLNESKNEGHNSIGQYVKGIVLRRHKNRNKSNDF